MNYTATDAAGNLAVPVTRTVNVVLDPAGDEDGDGLTNGQELTLGTDPYQKDTDGDGVNDPMEVADGTDPNNSSSLNGLNRGLVAYYPFNGNAKDESGNGNHAINLGASLALDRYGAVNKSYSFNGNEYIQTPLGSNFDNLSISVWFSSPTRSGERSIVDSDVSSEYGHSLILGYWDSGNSLDIQYHDGEYKSPRVLS